VRAGVGALFGAKQLGLDDALGQRAAVDRDEGRLGPGREAVDRAGEEFFAGAALAHQQHRRRRRRRLPRDVEHPPQRRGLADDAAGAGRRLPGVGELGLERAVFGEQRDFFERPGHHPLDLRPAKRLGHEVVGALAHRLDRALDGAVGRHQDDLGVGRDGLDVLEQLGAAHVRHHQIGQHHIDRRLAHRIERLAPARRRQHPQVEPLEDAHEAREVGGVVVDDEQGGVHRP
jgi:hypothetical protein